MEKQYHIESSKATADTSFEEYIKTCVSPSNVGGDKIVCVKEWNHKSTKNIPTREATLVFRPEKRRGANGVMLPEFKGVYEFREVFTQFYEHGFATDTVFYPLGIPLKHFSIHHQGTTPMICGTSTGSWKKYELLGHDVKYL